MFGFMGSLAVSWPWVLRGLSSRIVRMYLSSLLYFLALVWRFGSRFGEDGRGMGERERERWIGGGGW